MSVNPLQGIQVINSVNPCSSTPLHQPIYPYHYRAFPPLAELRPAPSPSPLSSLSSTPLPLSRLLAHSLTTPGRSIYPIQSESRLTSPYWSTPQTTRTLGKSRKLRLQRLFCARRGPNPNSGFSPSLARILLPSSGRLYSFRRFILFSFPLLTHTLSLSLC